MVNNKFRFWLPAEILEKGGEGKGEAKAMKLGGIASTSDKDTDGQNLIPSGFDISYLKSRGFINWNHKKSPDDIIGEPSKAQITKSGLYVEADLYPDSDLAKRVYKLAKVLQKNSSKRRLGFSIEGKATECDPLNPNKVTKAMITNIAITPSPKNITSIIDIVKGEVDWRNSPEEDDFEEIVIKPNDVEIHKSANTEEDSELIPEEVEGNLKVTKDKKKKEKVLTKGEVYDYLFDSIPVITFENAGKLYTKIKQFAMATKKKITKELLEKAIDALDLNKGIGEDEKTKGGKEEKLQKAKKKKGDDDEDMEECDDEMDLKKGEEEETEEETEDLEKGFDPEDDDDEDDDDEDYRKSRKVSKSVKSKKIAHIAASVKPDNSIAIVKAIGNLKKENKSMFQSVGVILKSVMDELAEMKEENTLLKGQLDELNTNVNGTHQKIDQIAFTPAVGRKSITKSIERTFEKGMDANGNPIGAEDKNVLSISRNKQKVLSMLDSMTFEKGMDNQLAEDLQNFEISGNISSYGISKFKEKGFTLVK